jgi:hypothetical protein
MSSPFGVYFLTVFVLPMDLIAFDKNFSFLLIFFSKPKKKKKISSSASANDNNKPAEVRRM